ncbi:hypothetical protein ONZ45_g1569 [Pleurotus djamor]|nr:hypothetical protein ONZ45_g1569 [Pleurotus djamor]
MARATRSNAHNQEKESSSTTTTTTPASPTRAKHSSKKRKRASQPDEEDEPSTKQPKTDNAATQEEKDAAAGSPDEEVAQSQTKTRPSIPHAGDTPIRLEDATKILEILEVIDTQGLLDRVFPLAEDTSTSTPSYRSLRWLLTGDPTPSKLSVLRSAVQHLVPISHSRSKPSKPATQQRRFCDIALSLLDQASFHNVEIPPDLESVLPEVHSDDDDIASIQLASPRQQKRYALKQKLPTGDWWTSLSSDVSDPEQIRNLTAGYAELVVSLPAPSRPTEIAVASSSSKSTPSSTTSVVPSLGSYTYLRAIPPKTGPAKLHKRTTGSFLDYGVNASFAPSFTQDGTEIGREELGELLYRKEQSRRERAAELLDASLQEQDDVMEIDPVLSRSEAAKSTVEDVVDIDHCLKDLLPPEEIEGIKSALCSLELETAVQELLERNSRALVRLQDLQKARLQKGVTVVDSGSEELETAQAIMDSLELLASLRPRSSKDGPDVAPLIPSPALLRVLHRTLPIQASPGWNGTLPSTSKTAVHDNTTVKIKPGAVVSTPAATTVPTPTPAAAGGNYYPYGTYPNTAQQYRPPVASSYSFKSQAPTSYYPPAYATQPQQGAQQTQPYGQQMTYLNGTSGQMQYGSWYNYSSQYGAVAGGSNSGRGTPTQTAIIPTANSYGSFFTSTSNAQTPGQVPRTPAVANTVTSKGYPTQPIGQSAWPTTAVNGYGVVGQPTLPAHLRSSAVPSTPGTPSPGTPTIPLVPGAYQQQTPYYSAFQQPSAAPAR